MNAPPPTFSRPSATPLDSFTKSDEVAAADRQRLDLLPCVTTRLRFRLCRLDERRLGADRHLLGNLAEAHRDVGVGRAADRQDDAGLNRGLEARELGAHFVDARLQRREAVAAVGAGGRRADALVAVFFAVTVVPGSAAPVSSRTAPVSVAVAICAPAWTGKPSNIPIRSATAIERGLGWSWCLLD